MVLLRKSIPQNRNLKAAAELNVKDSSFYFSFSVTPICLKAKYETIAYDANKIKKMEPNIKNRINNLYNKLGLIFRA